MRICKVTSCVTLPIIYLRVNEVDDTRRFNHKGEDTLDEAVSSMRTKSFAIVRKPFRGNAEANGDLAVSQPLSPQDPAV